jgi:hypothetical protein
VSFLIEYCVMNFLLFFTDWNVDLSATIKAGDFLILMLCFSLAFSLLFPNLYLLVSERKQFIMKVKRLIISKKIVEKKKKIAHIKVTGKKAQKKEDKKG